MITLNSLITNGFRISPLFNPEETSYKSTVNDYNKPIAKLNFASGLIS